MMLNLTMSLSIQSQPASSLRDALILCVFVELVLVQRAHPQWALDKRANLVMYAPVDTNLVELRHGLRHLVHLGSCTDLSGAHLRSCIVDLSTAQPEPQNDIRN